MTTYLRSLNIAKRKHLANIAEIDTIKLTHVISKLIRSVRIQMKAVKLSHLKTFLKGWNIRET